MEFKLSSHGLRSWLAISDQNLSSAPPSGTFISGSSRRGHRHSYDPIVLMQTAGARHLWRIKCPEGSLHSSASRMVNGTRKHCTTTCRPSSSLVTSSLRKRSSRMAVASRVTLHCTVCSPTFPCRSPPPHSTSTSTTPSKTRFTFSTTTGSFREQTRKGQMRF